MLKYLLFIFFISCGSEEYIHNDEFVNTWWELQDNELYFYLQYPEQKVFWSVDEPYDYLYYNQQDGAWFRIDEDKFNIIIDEEEYEISAKYYENDCYKISYGILVNDIACPFEF